MRVTIIGKMNVDSLAKVLNEVFDSMTQEEIEYMERIYKQKQVQNKKYLKAG